MRAIPTTIVVTKKNVTALVCVRVVAQGGAGQPGEKRWMDGFGFSDECLLR